MIDGTIHTFEQCLEIANQCITKNKPSPKKHLILGNGFSIAFRPDIFSYKSLTDLIKSPEIINLFDRLGTKDFEYVMRRLTDAREMVMAYPENEKINTGMGIHLDQLREMLIEVISDSHPVSSREIDDEQYESCRLFLENFENGNKYTFNYDLLLYWVYMHFKDEKLTIGDGFGNSFHNDVTIVTWDISRAEKQNVYYLHGAMHLFNDKGIIRKFSWANSGRPITDQVCASIDAARYPMFISEGTKEHKLLRIRDCSYLDHAFHSLDDIDDNLFIFGHSLGDEDDHVFNRINSNKNLKNIFISIFDDDNSPNNQRTMNKANRWIRRNPDKNYYFYHAESANVWETPATP